MPEMTVGMPITSPENVELPPRYSAYLLPEETTTKNVVFETRKAGRYQGVTGHRWSFLEHNEPTCRSTLVNNMITSDRILGSLNSPSSPGSPAVSMTKAFKFCSLGSNPPRVSGAPNERVLPDGVLCGQLRDSARAGTAA